MTLSSLIRSFHTLRHLRPRQMYWRVRYALEKKKNPSLGTPPPELGSIKTHSIVTVPTFLHANYESAGGSFDLQEHALETFHRLEAGRLSMFNVTLSLRPVERAPIDWRLGPQAEHRIWATRFHQHAWLHDLAVLTAGGTEEGVRAGLLLSQFLLDWISQVDISRPGTRELAWNPYTVATRLTYWVRIHRLVAKSGMDSWHVDLRKRINPKTLALYEPGHSPASADELPPFDLEALFLNSFWRQAEFLSRHVEWDLMGNHLLRDAVGLVTAGRFIAHPHAKKWLTQGLELGKEQVAEQISDDGSHFERSPMYQMHVMEDLMALTLLDQENRGEYQNKWVRMSMRLSELLCADGTIPLFNDSSINGGPDPQTMIVKGWAALGLDVTQFAAEKRADDDEQILVPRTSPQVTEAVGLQIWHEAPWLVFFDAGPIGPDYQTAHAHADSLSVELGFAGRRLVIDPGTYGYDDNEARRYDRSTAAHNTVCIDGQNSSDVWDIFRVGRRAVASFKMNFDPQTFETLIENDAVRRFRGTHDGYIHLPGGARHTRSILFPQNHSLVIKDAISGNGEHEISAGYLLAPEWSARPILDGVNQTGWLLRSAYVPHDLKVTIESPLPLKMEIVDAPYHPEFGREIMTKRLVWRTRRKLPIEVHTIFEKTSG